VRTWARRALATLLGAGALVVAVPNAASAHPLGNFTVNRFSGIVVSSEAVTVEHVLDIAEIPTAQRKSAVDTSGDGTMSRAELASWAGPTCKDAAQALQLTVAGNREPLAVDTASARTLPGQAGLPILRVECELRAGVAALSGTTSVRLVDTGGQGEVGWKEMTAQGDGTTLTRSDVPERSASGRLTSYPEDLLSNPLDVLTARLAVLPGGPALDSEAGSAVLPSGPLGRGADRLTSAFERLLERADDGPLLGLVALLGAVLLGAAHAVAPGHGKTIMAFYLSGRRAGALRAAATVGGTVTATHTAGVLLLGVIASAGTALAPAEVYPWLSVASGLLVVAVGVALLRAARRGAPGHTHGTGPGQHTHGPVPTAARARGELVTSVAADQGKHAGLGSTVEVTEPHHEHHEHPSSPGVSDPAHHHDHDHDRDHEHHHDQAPPEHTHEVADLSPRGLVAIGLAGGLLPSPSAVIVFLGALGLGRPWFGVALVIAFGLGMATTLAVVGLLVMRLRERAEARLASRPKSRFAPILRVIPLVTAIAVVVLGAALALRGFSSTGVI